MIGGAEEGQRFRTPSELTTGGGEVQIKIFAEMLRGGAITSHFGGGCPPWPWAWGSHVVMRDSWDGYGFVRGLWGDFDCARRGYGLGP